MAKAFQQVSVLLDKETLLSFKMVLLNEGQDMSSLIRSWVKTYVDKKLSQEKEVNDVSLNLLTKPSATFIKNDLPSIVKLADELDRSEETKEPIVAPCTYEHCFIKRPQFLTEVTYLDDYQSRTFGPICASCINKAKDAGMFIGEGDQR